MRDALHRGLGILLAGAALASTAAWALPWNVDLVDADMVKAYEQPMRTLPEGVMAQPDLLTPVAYRRNYSWTSTFHSSHTWPESTTTGKPFDPDAPAVQAVGAKMYTTYCVPCHGDGEQLGYVATSGKYPAVAVLAGADGRLQNQTNGHVYLTVRNGSLSKLMPSYGYAMTDDEIWALLAYMRTSLPNAAYKPPAPAPAEEQQ